MNRIELDHQLARTLWALNSSLPIELGMLEVTNLILKFYEYMEGEWIKKSDVLKEPSRSIALKKKKSLKTSSKRTKKETKPAMQHK